MKIWKKMLCIILSVVILTFTVGSDLAGANQVKAADPITVPIEEILFEILLSFGSSVLSVSGVSADLGDEYAFSKYDVALFGYDYLVENGYDPLITEVYDNICSVYYLDSTWKEATLSATIPTDMRELLSRGYYVDSEGNVTDFGSRSDSIGLGLKQGFFNILDTAIDFVGKVINGTNTLALGSHVIAVDDLVYTGELETDASGLYTVKVVASYVYGEKYGTQVVTASTVSGTRPFATVNENGLAFFTCFKPSSYPVGYSVKVNGTRTVNDGTRTYDFNEASVGSSSMTDFSYSVNVPVFSASDTAGIKEYVANGDDSACINKEIQLDFSDIVASAVALPLAVIGTSKFFASNLYDSLVNVKSGVDSGTITDTATYTQTLTDSLTTAKTLGQTITVGSSAQPTTAPRPTPVPIPDDADTLSLVQMIAGLLSTFPLLVDDVSIIGEVFPAVQQEISAIGDIFPTIQQELSTIGDIFPSMQQELSAIGDVFPALLSDISILGEIFPIAESIEELMNTRVLPKIEADSLVIGSMSEALSGTITDALTDIKAGTLTIPDILTDVKSYVMTIPDALTDIKTQVASLSLADVKEAVGELVLSIIDYTGLLEKIIELLKSILDAITDFKSFFIIDTAAIKSHTITAVKAVPAIDQFDFILAYLDDLKASITDSYEYPVIAVDTPEILKPYYKSARIILVDFEDYATYFIWARTFIAFSICFGMLLWVLQQFEFEFSID